jgi:mono/diheme cytochrome c family protein
VKRLGKVFAIVALVIAALVVVGVTFTIGWRPFIGPKARPLTSRTFERTPERLARGTYLVEAQMGCMVCHSPHDWTKHDPATLTGMKGAGQDFGFLKGLPGRVVAPNLTPDPETGAGNWSDDTLARAIREGIGHDGRALFPLMPYEHYRNLPDEDLASVIVYLRALQPVRNPLPSTEIIFPVKYLIRGVPKPVTAAVPAPDLSTPVKRGEHFVEMGGCTDCHTPQDKGQPLPGMDFAGGFVLEGPWGYVASANLTPDPSGIPYYDEALFLQTMRTGYVKARELKQIMPWDVYRNMKDDDLKDIFAYLKTLKPVHHRVDNSEPPTMCPLCKSAHGAGDQNKGI